MGAAETGPWDIVKLYNEKEGEIYNIDNNIPSNGTKNNYELQMVVIGLGMIQESLTNDIKNLEARITNLERRINGNDLPLPPTVQHLKTQVDVFREKLENTESLSFLGKSINL